MNDTPNACHACTAYTLDLGNTRLKLGVWSAQGVLLRTHHWPWRHNPNATWQAVHTLCAQSPAPIGVCSVIGADTQTLLAALQPQYSVHMLKPTPYPSLQLGGYSAQQLGADRWINALAATVHYAAQPVMIIDMGTSTTLDCVSAAGVFAGGAIVPGLNLFANILPKTTDKLSAFPLPTQPLNAQGHHTQACLQVGVSLGYVAMIMGIVQQWHTSNTPVVITGGDAPAFLAMAGPACAQWHHQPDWTLMGAYYALQNLLALPTPARQAF
jgi:pantothenate kinase type III